MGLTSIGTMRRTLRNSRVAWWRWSVDRFQPSNHTFPNRYPWLFEFARETLGDSPNQRILSFGCSTGAEVFTLRSYFSQSNIVGLDVNRLNIAKATLRTCGENKTGLSFRVATSTENESSESCDAIFCLAVLCHGDLTTSGAQRCDHLLRFEHFERITKDFARCLKPGGLLVLHTANFRFCDTVAAAEFDVVFTADASQLAPDVLFDRENRLMTGMRYQDVAFRKRRRDIARR